MINVHEPQRDDLERRTKVQRSSSAASGTAALDRAERAQGRRGKASFQIREEVQTSPRFPMWMFGVLFAGAALGGYRWFSSGRVDEEFLRTERLVSNYERGKEPEAINYLDPLYDEAMERLSRAGSGSLSAADAARLLAKIRNERKAFSQRLKDAQARMDRARADQEARTAALLAAQEASSGTDPSAASRQSEAAATAPGCQVEERRQRHR